MQCLGLCNVLVCNVLVCNVLVYRAITNGVGLMVTYLSRKFRAMRREVPPSCTGVDLSAAAFGVLDVDDSVGSPSTALMRGNR